MEGYGDGNTMHERSAELHQLQAAVTALDVRIVFLMTAFRWWQSYGFLVIYTWLAALRFGYELVFGPPPPSVDILYYPCMAAIYVEVIVPRTSKVLDAASSYRCLSTQARIMLFELIHVTDDEPHMPLTSANEHTLEIVRLQYGLLQKLDLPQIRVSFPDTLRFIAREHVGFDDFNLADVNAVSLFTSWTPQ